MRSLVTGAAGSVGSALANRLPHPKFVTDLTDYQSPLDVTSREDVRQWVESTRPDVIFHLAGAKHAPDGELDPQHVAVVNITGTANVLAAARQYGARVVLASTCKACDPETAYGASKLIAERMVLNADGVVVRYFNIPESSGNVFRLWEQLPLTAPIPWTHCWRYFVPLDRCVDLTVAAANFPTGRYAPDPGSPRHMRDVAADLYPGRELVEVPLRRGDRRKEPLTSACEEARQFGGHLVITGPHDPLPEAATVEVAA